MIINIFYILSVESVPMFHHNNYYKMIMTNTCTLITITASIHLHLIYMYTHDFDSEHWLVKILVDLSICTPIQAAQLKKNKQLDIYSSSKQQKIIVYMMGNMRRGGCKFATIIVYLAKATVMKQYLGQANLTVLFYCTSSCNSAAQAVSGNCSV